MRFAATGAILPADGQRYWHSTVGIMRRIVRGLALYSAWVSTNSLLIALLFEIVSIQAMDAVFVGRVDRTIAPVIGPFFVSFGSLVVLQAVALRVLLRDPVFSFPRWLGYLLLQLPLWITLGLLVYAGMPTVLMGGLWLILISTQGAMIAGRQGWQSWWLIRWVGWGGLATISGVLMVMWQLIPSAWVTVIPGLCYGAVTGALVVQRLQNHARTPIP